MDTTDSADATVKNGKRPHGTSSKAQQKVKRSNCKLHIYTDEEVEAMSPEEMKRQFLCYRTLLDFLSREIGGFQQLLTKKTIKNQEREKHLQLEVVNEDPDKSPQNNSLINEGANTSMVFPTFSSSSQPTAHPSYWQAPPQPLYIAVPYKPTSVHNVFNTVAAQPTSTNPKPFDSVAVIFKLQKNEEINNEMRAARVKLLSESLGLQLASINDLQANGYTIEELIVIMEKLLTCVGRLSRHYQQIVIADHNRLDDALIFHESLTDAEMHLQTIQRLENMTPQQGDQRDD